MTISSLLAAINAEDDHTYDSTLPLAELIQNLDMASNDFDAVLMPIQEVGFEIDTLSADINEIKVTEDTINKYGLDKSLASMLCAQEYDTLLEGTGVSLQSYIAMADDNTDKTAKKDETEKALKDRMGGAKDAAIKKLKTLIEWVVKQIKGIGTKLAAFCGSAKAVFKNTLDKIADGDVEFKDEAEVDLVGNLKTLTDGLKALADLDLGTELRKASTGTLSQSDLWKTLIACGGMAEGDQIHLPKKKGKKKLSDYGFKDVGVVKDIADLAGKAADRAKFISKSIDAGKKAAETALGGLDAEKDADKIKKIQKSIKSIAKAGTTYSALYKEMIKSAAIVCSKVKSKKKKKADE
ncbi:MAG: hypothetical protein GY804_08645 [Alphaproteobacteria bacterium]|nr:hypothetical protein [Alphaproteobacteria bacterium]